MKTATITLLTLACTIFNTSKAEITSSEFLNQGPMSEYVYSDHSNNTFSVKVQKPAQRVRRILKQMNITGPLADTIREELSVASQVRDNSFGQITSIPSSNFIRVEDFQAERFGNDTRYVHTSNLVCIPNVCTLTAISTDRLSAAEGTRGTTQYKTDSVSIELGSRNMINLFTKVDLCKVSFVHSGGVYGTSGNSCIIKLTK